MDGEVQAAVHTTTTANNTMDNKDPATSNGTAPAMEDSENPLIVDGKISLIVHLPDNRTVYPTVDASVAMMDLLVHIAAKNRLSPAAHVIQVPAPYPGDDPIQFKPNTHIGELGVRNIEIVPKKTPESKVPVKKSAKFEQTVRLTVHVSKSKKFVLRVNPDKALCELLPQICDEHGTDPFHCTLRLVNSPEEDLDLFKSLHDYDLKENEVILVDLRAPVPQVPMTDDKPKEKKKKSIFGFRSSLKKKSKGDGDTDSVKSLPVRTPSQQQLHARDTASVTSAPARPPPQAHTRDTDSIKSAPVRPPPYAHAKDTDSVHSVPVRSPTHPHPVKSSPKPARPNPPPGAVALPVIDGSLLRKQQQQQNAPPPPPPQPPARKRQAPRPPGPPPRKNQIPGGKTSPSDQPVRAEPVENKAESSVQVVQVHVENINQSPNASLQSNENSPLGDRIVIGQECQFALTDSNQVAATVPLQNSPVTLPSPPPQGQTTATVTAASSPTSTEPSSGTLKKRKAPPPPKPPQPVFAGTPPPQAKKPETPPSVKKRAPPQPSPRHQRQTSTGSTASDSSSGQMIDSSPAATPPTTLDRPSRPPRHSIGPSLTKESSPLGQIIAETDDHSEEEPPSPESTPEDIDKLIQEGRLSVATTQRRDSLSDNATTEDSSSVSDRSTSALSASARSSLVDEEDEEMQRDDEKRKSDADTDNEADDIAEMLKDVVKEQEQEIVAASPSVDVETTPTKVIAVTTESATVDVKVEPTKAVVASKEVTKDDESDDDLELTEEEAKILAELEAEADAEETKEAKEGESSATESEDLALKDDRTQILNQMMKLSLDDQKSNDTVNYSPSNEPEQEMLEEKLISQLAYPVVRTQNQQVPVGYASKSDSSLAESSKAIEITPEADSTESQQDEDRENEMMTIREKETKLEAEHKAKKMIVVDVNIGDKSESDDVEDEEGDDVEKETEKESVVKSESNVIEDGLKVKTKDVEVKVETKHAEVKVETKDVKVKDETEHTVQQGKKPEEHLADGVSAGRDHGIDTKAPASSDGDVAVAATEAKFLQEQYTMLQQQFAALQQQMISNQQAVLQQQQNQIASASSTVGLPTAGVTNPMMMSQPQMMMPPGMTQQQMMMMQQQMMMQYPMGMPPQYMVPPQMMTVPQAPPVAMSPPQVIGYPQPVMTSSPQQPVVLATSPPQNQMKPEPQVTLGSPPRQQVQPEPHVTVGSPPKAAELEPEVEMPEVVYAKEGEEKKKQSKPFGIEIDPQGNIKKSSMTVMSSWKDDNDVSNTWVGSRNRSSSNPSHPGTTDHSTDRPRSGTLDREWPLKNENETQATKSATISHPTPTVQQEKKIVIIDTSKPVQPHVVPPKEGKVHRDVIINQIQPPAPSQPQKVQESKPKEIVIIENVAKPEEPSKPKEEKPTREIVIIENPATTQAAAAATTSTSTTTNTEKETTTGRPGYSQYAARGGIPTKSKYSLYKAASEVQIRHLHSPREDELSATRESASVSRLRGMFGGAGKS